MENFRHRSLKPLLPREPGDSHGDNKSVIVPVLWSCRGQSCNASALLCSPLLTLLGLSRVCWWQVSSPSRFRPCCGTDSSWEMRAFPDQCFRKVPSLVDSEKKGCNPGPARSSGSAAIAFFGSNTSHCSGLFFKLFYFSIMPKHFLFPIGMEDARDWHYDHMLTKELRPPPSSFF